MNRSLLAGVILLTGFGIKIPEAWSHCQVPCGIFDESARLKMMDEDLTTIKKAMQQIAVLHSKRDPSSLNQATRWVMTKEDHANHIMDLIANYFLAQRVKIVEKGKKDYEVYLKQLADYHAVLVAAMKCKQTADLSQVDGLARALKELAP